MPRFLNLWIGLETLSRSNSRRDAIDQIEDLAPPLLTRRYAYRLLRNFLGDVMRADIDVSTLGLHETALDARLRELLLLLQSPAGVKTMVSAFHNVPLLQFRVLDYSALLGTGRAAAAALHDRRKRLSWHLRRMYRVRNRIVHNADVNAPLHLLNNHLQSYCRVAINELVSLILRCDPPVSIDSILQGITDGMRVQSELLARRPARYPPELILDSPVSSVNW